MLTEESKRRIEESVKKYRTRRSAVMEALRIAQEGKGYISKEDMEDIARLLGMQPVEVNAAATFYTMYSVKKPVGKYHIQVCRNISCSLLGVEHLIEHIGKTLGIKEGETTRDSRFTLSTVECLGSCGTAPVMQINEDYHESLTAEKIDGILRGLK